MPMKKSPSSKLITTLQLSPHPEGGFFRETYRAKQKIATCRGDRSASTSILFLLACGHRSRLHRIQSDEQWHFYLGGPLKIIEIDSKGRVCQTILGPDLNRGQVLQHVVPAGRWFGAIPAPRARWSLVGCTVAPGFDFKDFELGNRDELLRAYPHCRCWILKLT